MKTLEKIIKSVKTTAKAALVTAALSVSGCLGLSGYTSLHSTRSGKDYGYFEQGVRLNLPYVAKYDVSLGDRIQTTPVHPDDGGAAAGSATTNITTWINYDWGRQEENSSAMPYAAIGYEASTGTCDSRLKFGVDFRHLYETDYRRGIFDIEHQPVPFASYAFTQFNQTFTTTPFVGYEMVFGNFILGLEAGLPIANFHVRSGHDRYGSWESVQEQAVNGVGTRLTLLMGWTDRSCYDGLIYAVSVTQEKFDNLEFAGQKATVDCRYGSLSIQWSF